VSSCVFVFLFHRTKHLKYCVRQLAEGDIWSEERESSVGMKKFAQ